MTQFSSRKRIKSVLSHCARHNSATFLRPLKKSFDSRLSVRHETNWNQKAIARADTDAVRDSISRILLSRVCEHLVYGKDSANRSQLLRRIKHYSYRENTTNRPWKRGV